MTRIEVQMTPRGQLFSKKVVIAILVLAIVVAGMTALWVYTFAPTQPDKPQAVQQPIDTAPRSNEIPISARRALSMTATQQPTSSMPWGTAIDAAHGYVWVAEPGCEPVPTCPTVFPGILGQYALSDGTFLQDVKEPSGYSSPLFPVVDANGHVWFTQPNSDAIGEFNPQTDTWNKFPTKKGSAPYNLTLDANGNLWFTEIRGNNIGFLNTQTNTIVENPIPTPGSSPYGITVDTKGTIWFAENAVGINQIGSFTPTTSGVVKITEHVVNGLRPHLITTDKTGNVWFSEGFAGFIGEYTPASGSSKSFLVTSACLNPATCTGSHISSVRVDDRGYIWFSDSLSQRIGYLIPATGQVVTRTLTVHNAHPHDGLILDGNGRVWFTEQDTFNLVMWPLSAVG